MFGSAGWIFASSVAARPDARRAGQLMGLRHRAQPADSIRPQRQTDARLVEGRFSADRLPGRIVGDNPAEFRRCASRKAESGSIATAACMCPTCSQRRRAVSGTDSAACASGVAHRRRRRHARPGSARQLEQSHRPQRASPTRLRVVHQRSADWWWRTAGACCSGTTTAAATTTRGRTVSSRNRHSTRNSTPLLARSGFLGARTRPGAPA